MPLAGPVPQGLPDNHGTTTVKILLIVHQKTSLLTDRHRPLLHGGTRPSDGACTQPKMPSPGGQISRMTSHKNCCGWVRGRGVASHRSPGGLPHANPGAEPDHARAGSVEGCPRAGVWSGCARSTGCHTAPAHKIESWGRRRAVGRREAVRNPEKQREPSSRSTPLHHTVDAGGDAWGGRAGL